MAYATGTVANSAALQVIIEDFCTANGWTLNAGAGSWLSKGQSHVGFYKGIRSVSSVYRTGTTGKINQTGHEYSVGDTVTIAGVTGTDAGLYNGTFIITTVINTALYYVTLAGTPAANSPPGTITATLVSSPTTLNISGANSADGLTEFCPFSKSIYIDAVSWPVTYHLFYDTAPDQVSCVLNYDTTKIQTIMFGDIVKVHNSAYVGGNWFFASKYSDLTKDNCLHRIDDVNIFYGYGNYGDASGSPLPFVNTAAGGPYVQDESLLHCKIDSHIWGTFNTASKISMTDPTLSSYFRGPNTWNSQAQLVPIHLQFTMASSLYGYLGYVEHLRFLRIDNYEIGDIITLGSDKWKVFPWTRKDTTNRNGVYNVIGSGTLGFACRYTP